jgi:hypothetical protein
MSLGLEGEGVSTMSLSPYQFTIGQLAGLIALSALFFWMNGVPGGILALGIWLFMAVDKGRRTRSAGLESDRHRGLGRIVNPRAKAQERSMGRPVCAGSWAAMRVLSAPSACAQQRDEGLPSATHCSRKNAG